MYFWVKLLQMMKYIGFVLVLFVSLNSHSQKKMKIPPYLKKGDTVAIVCTARKFMPEDAKPAIELLESWALKAKLGRTIGLDSCQLGGTDAERIADFQTMMDDENVKGIWVARGGYGTVRIIDSLDFTKFKKHPKWIMGFSDVTVLHSQLNVERIASLHSIMPFTVPKASEEVKETLRKALFGEDIAYTIPSKSYDKKGKASGELVGGNISILYSLLGSKSSINTKDKILFIEDLDEYLYHIDRMMINLKRNGCLESIKGIVVGSMTKMKDNDIPWGKNAIEIIEDVTKKYNIPVLYNFPAGHIQDNRALILGNIVTINVNEKCSTLVFE